MNKEQMTRNAVEQQERAIGRAYLTTTPAQHYTDQAKLALFDDAVMALEGIFAECVLMRKYWGEGSNTQQANAATAKARAVLAKARELYPRPQVKG